VRNRNRHAGDSQSACHFLRPACQDQLRFAARLVGDFHIEQRTPAPPPVPSSPVSRKVSHGHENVATIRERAPQPGHAINLRAMPRGGNSEQNRRALAGAKRRGDMRYACCATRDKGLGFLGQKRERGTASGSPSQVFVVNAVAASAGRCQRCAPQERCGHSTVVCIPGGVSHTSFPVSMLPSYSPARPIATP